MPGIVIPARLRGKNGAISRDLTACGVCRKTFHTPPRRRVGYNTLQHRFLLFPQLFSSSTEMEYLNLSPGRKKA